MKCESTSDIFPHPPKVNKTNYASEMTHNVRIYSEFNEEIKYIVNKLIKYILCVCMHVDLNPHLIGTVM